jgi:hypothetical protein
MSPAGRPPSSIMKPESGRIAGRSRTVTDTLICSSCPRHTAALAGNGWTVTWLPGWVLTRSQAEAAMAIAEEVGTIPAGADPEAYDDVVWDCINGWASRLGLSGPRCRRAGIRTTRRAAGDPGMPAMRSDLAPHRVDRVDRPR